MGSTSWPKKGVPEVSRKCGENRVPCIESGKPSLKKDVNQSIVVDFN